MEVSRTSSKGKDKSMKKRKKSEACSSTPCLQTEQVEAVERPSKRKKHHKKSVDKNEEQGKKRRKKSSRSTEKENKSNLDCSRRERDETEQNIELDERTEELRQRLKEEPVEKMEVQVEKINPLHSNWNFKKEEIKLLQTQGVKIKVGKWSKIEVETLQKNMEHYLQANDLTDPAPLIYRKDYENKDSQLQAKNTQFYVQLAKGIDRPLFHIYKRVLRMYDETNYCGKWSPSDTDTLLRLHAIYGDQWTKIGKHLGRSGMAVNHKYLTLQKSSPGYCPWTEDERDLLNGAVRAATHTDFDSQIYSSINWTEVSSFVGSRTPEQCRTKWFKDVCWMNGDGSKNIKWNYFDDIILIERLYAGDEYDENDIDWLKMAEGFSNSPSREWLRLKWCTLKKAVPNYTELDYEDILDYLCNVHRSVLKEQARREHEEKK